ncbi:MAG: homoserine O-acetyltransferase [Actinomycetia bacterium]|nr:homoserine O-acetyltransferase [Actinomycetes bacterium]
MNHLELPPTATVWREGDPVANRQFADVGELALEFGTVLPAVTVAYETWGTLSPDRNNAILVEHALTGDAHAAGSTQAGQLTPGWWDAIIGPGKAIDTNVWFVVAANVLGGCQGTTGPGSLAPDDRPWGSRWPRISVRDQVATEARLADELGITSFRAVVGGSMGGMRALEWALLYPQRLESAIIVATGAAATADQIALQTAQIEAITTDAAWQGGDYYATGSQPTSGLGVARRFAHLSYRTEAELHERFGTQPQPDEDPHTDFISGRHPGAGRFAVQSYFDHHASKLAERFDAGSYVSLTDAMNTHDVSRGRGDLEQVLGGVQVPVWVAGVDSDRLYPIRLQEQMCDLIPQAAPLTVITSKHGHDGFLVESQAVGDFITKALQ